MKITRVTAQHGRYYYVRDLEERNPATGKPRQKWIPLTRISDGEAALHDALAKLLGTPAKKVGNLPKLLQAFRKEHLPGLTLDVAKEYGRMYDVIADGFEEFNVDQVIPGTVLAFLNDRFQGKPTARRHFKARLSTFFSWCVLNSYCQVNPCAEIKLKAPPKRRGRMNDALYWAYFDALSPMGQCFLELTFLTRQRPTEIRLLRESAIGADRIRFKPTKTEGSSGEEVEILITPQIRRCLDRARSLPIEAQKVKEERKKRKGAKGGQVIELNRRRDPFIIQSEDGGHFTKSGMNSVWRRARDKLVKDKIAGAGAVTTRDIRPYALHKMEEAGFTLREIQLSAAHSTVTTTEGYLDQHRARISDAVLDLPPRPK